MHDQAMTTMRSFRYKCLQSVPRKLHFKKREMPNDLQRAGSSNFNVFNYDFNLRLDTNILHIFFVQTILMDSCGLNV